MFVCFFCFVLFHLKPFAQAEASNVTSEGGLLWFILSPAIIPETFPTLLRGDVDMRTETNGNYPMEDGL